MDQSDRRDRILTAALRHAGNGYREVRIREVADAAGVVTSTVYSHFPSKDGLLLECLLDWLECFADEGGVTTVDADDPYRRLLRTIEAITDQLPLTPRRADSMARSYLHATGAAARTAELVRATLMRIFTEALSRDRPRPLDHDRHVAELVTDVWIASALAVAQNRATQDDLHQRLGHAIAAIRETAARRAAAHPAVTGP
ncbi:TetR family transcriptional regulator [Mycobacterium koreense]|nr:TetR family transcriptional regulator [Mycolicibacillus koreensis]MCV7250540.1 TetR family transcriptional regulator [Mycolicibacillus koreensis]ODR04832.1 hypothetical protein BHQ15_16630 [Mycolicibacillus koreensis]BBY56407.1 hypothetical protein MKOR_36580 [Mycolicibacillus koreensis]